MLHRIILIAFLGLSCNLIHALTTENLITGGGFSDTSDWSSTLGFQTYSGSSGHKPAFSNGQLYFAYATGTVSQTITLPTTQTLTAINLTVDHEGPWFKDGVSVSMSTDNGGSDSISCASPCETSSFVLEIANNVADATTLTISFSQNDGNPWAGNYGARFSNPSVTAEYQAPEAPVVPGATSSSVIAAQSMSTQHLMKAQMQHINSHLNALHHNFNVRHNRMHLGLKHPLLHAMNNTPLSQAWSLFNAAAQDAWQRWWFGEQPIALWGSAGAELGRVRVENNHNRFHVQGATLGLDVQPCAPLILGTSVGYGADRTRGDGLGSRGKGAQTTGTVYVSYQASPKNYIDLVAGYGDLSFDVRRFIPENGTYAFGQRGGDVWLGKLNMSHLLHHDVWEVSGTWGLEIFLSRLDPYDETGGGTYSLSYAERNDTSLLTQISSHAARTIQHSTGRWTPELNFSYQNNMSSRHTQNMNFNALEDSTTTYHFSHHSSPKHKGALDLGLRYQKTDAFKARLHYTAGRGTHHYQSHALRGDARWSF